MYTKCLLGAIDISLVSFCFTYLFYYGVFEYPRKSGNFYHGKHIPIITKELFLLVQEQVKSQILRTGISKDFAFARMMTCGLCGSGICADEKFKKRRHYRRKERAAYLF